MILVIGGAFQGKKEYVKKQFALAEEDFATGPPAGRKTCTGRGPSSISMNIYGGALRQGKARSSGSPYGSPDPGKPGGDPYLQ